MPHPVEATYRRDALKGNGDPVGTVCHLRWQPEKHEQWQGQHGPTSGQHIDKPGQTTDGKQCQDIDYRHESARPARANAGEALPRRLLQTRTAMKITTPAPSRRI